MARRAGHRDVAAQQARQVARDRQAEAGAAVPAADRPVGLAEGFEDRLLLRRSYADTAVAHFEADAVGAGASHVQRDAAVFGELHRVGQQVAQDLLEPLPVGEERGGRIRRHLHRQLQALAVRERLEHGLQSGGKRGDGGHFRPHLQPAGLHPGDVEDVVDQVQQVVAGRVDRFGKTDLLFRQVPLGVVGQQLREDQRAVEGGAKLVRHVGQEFGLVAAGALQFRGALLQLHLRFAQQVALLLQALGLFRQLHVGLLQFGLLVLQVRLRFLERARLLLQFLIRGAQFLLLHLQFLVEPLRLLQRVLQPLAETRAFQRSPQDGAGKAQKLAVARFQRPQQAELDDADQPPFVLDGRDQHGLRGRFAKPGVHLQVAGGDGVQRDLEALRRAFGDQRPVFRQALARLALLG